VAQQLQTLGVIRVRPLEGGFRKWKDLGFPLEESSGPEWKAVSGA